jgi:hypothetical protein
MIPMKNLFVFASLTAGVLAGSGRVALAEDAPDPMNASDLVNPTSVVRGAGVKVGEGTVISPTIGVETGVVSNVFYEENTTRMAGLLRILGDLSTGSLPGERLGIANEAATDPSEQAREVGMLQYLATLYATYDQYLSTSDAVQEQGGLGGGLLFKGIVNPQKTFSLSFLEHFDREVRATNFESGESLNRDVNQVALRLNFQPQGRSLGGYAYWRNLIDYFEDDTIQFSNRFQNTFGARVNYQWLPLTRVFLDGSIGVFSGLGSSSTKVDSYPLKVETGIQTALTLNLTLNARIGYTQGFYTQGDDFATVTGGIQVGYRYSPLGRATLLYDYGHHDSINANFYRDHLLKLSIDQQFVPFAVNAAAELHLRHYSSTLVMGTDGTNERDDVIGALNLSARYMFRGWIAAVATYQFAAVATDFQYDAGGGVIDDPSYLRHQLMVGIRAAY